jgi:hypothetical protein
MAHREKMLSSTQKLQSADIHLRQASSQAEEMVGQGIEIMGNLQENRDRMVDIKEKVKEFSWTFLRSFSFKESIRSLVKHLE